MDRWLRSSAESSNASCFLLFLWINNTVNPGMCVPWYMSSWIIIRIALYSIMRSSRARYALSFDVWGMRSGLMYGAVPCFSGPHFAHRLFYVSCIIDPLLVSPVADIEIFNFSVCDIPSWVDRSDMYILCNSSSAFPKDSSYWHVKVENVHSFVTTHYYLYRKIFFLFYIFFVLYYIYFIFI